MTRPRARVAADYLPERGRAICSFASHRRRSSVENNIRDRPAIWLYEDYRQTGACRCARPARTPPYIMNGRNVLVPGQGLRLDLRRHWRLSVPRGSNRLKAHDPGIDTVAYQANTCGSPNELSSGRCIACKNYLLKPGDLLFQMRITSQRSGQPGVNEALTPFGIRRLLNCLLRPPLPSSKRNSSKSDYFRP